MDDPSADTFLHNTSHMDTSQPPNPFPVFFGLQVHLVLNKTHVSNASFQSMLNTVAAPVTWEPIS